MTKETIIKNENGVAVAIRETSDDGRRSVLYEYTNDIVSAFVNKHRGKPIEIADHNEDGTTTAYEYDNSLLTAITDNHKGKKKS